MEVIESVSLMQARSEELRLAGHTLAFVPTMGFLHEGHLELMRVARSLADRVIVSIFVNPTQFGPKEDFAKYPRDREGDLAKVEGVSVDICFLPDVSEMYPRGFQTTVSVRELSGHLCGLSRPGHFDGVTTVVSKLFNITKPHIAVFGQKDYQQLAVISRMVTDTNMGIEIVGVPTVREHDGLAMSSRNAYLNRDERRSALCLKKAMDLAAEMFASGERDAKILKNAMERLIVTHPYTSIDYVAVCDPVTLDDLDKVGEQALVALAVKVGRTRLIDNCLLKARNLSERRDL
ncbi:MAG: pantoate--beta-alanine ligase [Desulfobacteraceae bacterium]|jgi:pantoate--beta-alanine ligase|nr:MAG: pantoate--beta-alanine ligase [Desulfobacteraceae bacterium]